MTADKLRKAAIELFGRRGWTTDLAAALKLDRTTIYRYVHGQIPIPGPVEAAGAHQSPVEELRPRLRDLLGESGFPQLLLRMGYGPEVDPTPRRTVARRRTRLGRPTGGGGVGNRQKSRHQTGGAGAGAARRAEPVRLCPGVNWDPRS